MTNLRWRLKRWFIIFRDNFPLNLILKKENENLRHLLSVASLSQGRTLDLGVGAGNVFHQLPQGCSFFGVDFTFSMLRTAKKEFPEANFVQAEAHFLPFKKDAFAAVTAIGLLEYIPDTIPLFNEVCRILKSGGVFIFTFAPKNIWSGLRNLLGHPIRMREVDQIASVINFCEFEIVEVKHSMMQTQVLIKKAKKNS